MHPDRVQRLVGARLAFVRGGNKGMRLVYLTPPIQHAQPYESLGVAYWSPATMPFRYAHAPLLIDNDARTNGFVNVRKAIARVRRKTW